VTEAAWSGNPAHQLHEILQSARTRASAENHPSVQGWRYALGLPPDAPNETVVRGLLSLGELCRETRRLVELSDSPFIAVTLERYQEVEEVVARTWALTNDMTWSLSGLTDTGMYSLRFCEQLIEQSGLAGPTVPGDRIDGLRQLVEELRGEVSKADFLTKPERFQMDALIDEITTVLSTTPASTPENLRRSGNRLTGYLLGRPKASEHLRGTRLGALLVVTVVTIQGITAFVADVNDLFHEPAIVQIQENLDVHVTVDQVTVLSPRAISQGVVTQPEDAPDETASR
jgi:hypothetical protein